MNHSEGGGGRRDIGHSESPGRGSPCSPFPFGSPLTCSTRSVLSPGDVSNPSSRSASSASVISANSSKLPLFNRLKGQDLYGGPVVFGGGSNSYRNRGDRILAASPYQSALRRKPKTAFRPASGSPAVVNSRSSSAASSSSSANNEDPARKGPTTDGMSSTARLILETLDNMSDPAESRDISTAAAAPSRAEKRRLLAEELDSSLSGGGKKRRRPDLSEFRRNGNGLNGPPLRTLFSPVDSPVNNSRRVGVKKNVVSNGVSPVSTENGVKTDDLASCLTSGLEAYKRLNRTCPTTEDKRPSNAAVGGKIRAKVVEAQRPAKNIGNRPLEQQQGAFSTVETSKPVTITSFSFSDAFTAEKTESKLPSKSKFLSSKPLNGDDEKTRDDSDEPLFAFSEPSKSGFTADGSEGADIEFSFSSPESTNPSRYPLTNGHSKTAESVVTVKRNDATAIESSFGSTILPDIATPATTLKNESVMSILGGGNEKNSGTDLWHSNYKSTTRPWS